MRRPRIAITIGDPGGVGAEITLKALADPATAQRAEWIVVADISVLEATARTCGIDWRGLGFLLHEAHGLRPERSVQFGLLCAEHGQAALEYVRQATELCLRGEADAMVTAPLNKEAVTLTGQQFMGHTEYIAQLCGAMESRMLLANDKLAVVHVSTHIPLQQACRLEKSRIVRTIQLGAEAVHMLRQKQPRVAVCGLNPHAGEHNLFGTQDSEVILPAVQAAQALGIPCSGPHSPDTIFLLAARGAYDLIVAMYHDQGHIPMKLLDFEQTVNISLGLPIIRTSVDHGTAFDIAGSDRADARNMRAAMRLAANMALGRQTMQATGGVDASG